MKTVLFLLLILLAVALLWFRLAPIDADDWHLDPAEADPPRDTGVRMIGPEAPRFPGTPDDVLGAFSDIALSDPRTRLLDGSLDEGMMTFVARSRVFGFPDLVTAKATAEGDRTKLSIISRAKYGRSDAGVNAARIDRWLHEMGLRLGEG